MGDQSNSDLGQEMIESLITESVSMMERAYSPYSKFRVGAALLAEDGVRFGGCNVENVSYGLTICAERTAMVKAVSEGHRKFRAMALSSDLAESHVTPCGACRQFLAEFGRDWPIILTKPDRSYIIRKVGDLLPDSFVPEYLTNADS